MNKKQYISVAIATIAGMAMTIPVFAQTSETSNLSRGMMRYGYQENYERGNGGKRMMVRPVVIGTVTAINGNIITLSGKQGMMNPSTANITFTIDATNAKVIKNNATGTLSSIVVGDNLSVQGTVSGTNVVATVIRDGVMARGKGIMNIENQIPLQVEGNGQPVIAGTVTSINGTTLTVTNKSNVTYTVNATNAKVTVKNVASTSASIATGDTIVIQGTVNGTSVVASTVIDSGAQKVVSTSQEDQGEQMSNRGGFFGGIGGFFARLFGF